LIEIRMRVGGEDVTYRRCGRCEAHAWETESGDIPLSRVLDLARPH
jgi:hypothetical protein